MTFNTKLREGRISLPRRLRTLAGVSDGDLVSVTLVRGRIVVTPARRATPSEESARKRQRAALLSRLRAHAPESLKAMWESSEHHGIDKMKMREIDALIAEVRREQRRG